MGGCPGARRPLCQRGDRRSPLGYLNPVLHRLQALLGIAQPHQFALTLLIERLVIGDHDGTLDPKDLRVVR